MRQRTVFLYAKTASLFPEWDKGTVPDLGDMYVTAQAVTDSRHALKTDAMWIKKENPLIRLTMSACPLTLCTTPKTCRRQVLLTVVYPSPPPLSSPARPPPSAGKVYYVEIWDRPRERLSGSLGTVW